MGVANLLLGGTPESARRKLRAHAKALGLSLLAASGYAFLLMVLPIFFGYGRELHMHALGFLLITAALFGPSRLCLPVWRAWCRLRASEGEPRDGEVVIVVRSALSSLIRAICLICVGLAIGLLPVLLMMGVGYAGEQLSLSHPGINEHALLVVMFCLPAAELL